MSEPKQHPSTKNGWIKWHDWNAGTMRSFTDWVCRAAALSPGDRVLDVASGTGLPALAAAAAVRPGGRVVATDVDASMLVALRDNAQKAGLENVEVREMASERLDVSDGAFDAVTWTFGLMFSQDPAQAVREVKRALRPGGTGVVAVWAPVEDNHFFSTLFATVGRFAPSPPPSPDAGPFRFAPAGKLEALLDEAGFARVKVEDVPITFEFASVEQHWEVAADMTPPIKAAAASLPESELARWRAALADAVRPYVGTDGRVRLPMKARGAVVQR